MDVRTEWEKAPRSLNKRWGDDVEDDATDGDEAVTHAKQAASPNGIVGKLKIIIIIANLQPSGSITGSLILFFTTRAVRPIHSSFSDNVPNTILG